MKELGGSFPREVFCDAFHLFSFTNETLHAELFELSQLLSCLSFDSVYSQSLPSTELKHESDPFASDSKNSLVSWKAYIEDVTTI